MSRRKSPEYRRSACERTALPRIELRSLPGLTYANGVVGTPETRWCVKGIIDLTTPVATEHPKTKLDGTQWTVGVRVSNFSCASRVEFGDGHHACRKEAQIGRLGTRPGLLAFSRTDRKN